jgi:hypothetical protein
MCYILCMTSSSVFYVTSYEQGGFGETPPRIFFLRKCVTFFSHFLCRFDFRVHCWEIFWHMVFADGFLFLVKELGLLTNPGHWVRVLDVVGSYMYIVL